MLKEFLVFLAILILIAVGVDSYNHSDTVIQREKQRMNACMRDARSHYPDEAFWKNFEADEKRLCAEGF